MDSPWEGTHISVTTVNKFIFGLCFPTLAGTQNTTQTASSCAVLVLKVEMLEGRLMHRYIRIDMRRMSMEHYQPQIYLKFIHHPNLSLYIRGGFIIIIVLKYYGLTLISK